MFSLKLETASEPHLQKSVTSFNNNKYIISHRAIRLFWHDWLCRERVVSCSTRRFEPFHLLYEMIQEQYYSTLPGGRGKGRIRP